VNVRAGGEPAAVGYQPLKETRIGMSNAAVNKVNKWKAAIARVALLGLAAARAVAAVAGPAQAAGRLRRDRRY
jgi:hypothetical protein